jgi:ABC-type transporter Mla maintaining outer membrane lipid asymmetry permease subunit MlaE
VLSQVVGTIREFYDFLSNAECPAEDASGTACAIVKNIAMGPILTALVVAQSVCCN